MTIGEEIKQKRKEKGLSQYKLCELTGISRVTICNVEHGRRVPRLDTVELLLRALDT